MAPLGAVSHRFIFILLTVTLITLKSELRLTIVGVIITRQGKLLRVRGCIKNRLTEVPLVAGKIFSILYVVMFLSHASALIKCTEFTMKFTEL